MKFELDSCFLCGIPDWKDTDAAFLAELAGEDYTVICDWCGDHDLRSPLWVLAAYMHAVDPILHQYGSRRGTTSAMPMEMRGDLAYRDIRPRRQ